MSIGIMTKRNPTAEADLVAVKHVDDVPSVIATTRAVREAKVAADELGAQIHACELRAQSGGDPYVRTSAEHELRRLGPAWDLAVNRVKSEGNKAEEVRKAAKSALRDAHRPEFERRLKKFYSKWDAVEAEATEIRQWLKHLSEDVGLGDDTLQIWYEVISAFPPGAAHEWRSRCRPSAGLDV